MNEFDKDADELATEDLAAEKTSAEIPEIIPLLPIRDLVIYPYMMIPLYSTVVMIPGILLQLMRPTAKSIL